MESESETPADSTASVSRQDLRAENQMPLQASSSSHAGGLRASTPASVRVRRQIADVWVLSPSPDHMMRKDRFRTAQCSQGGENGGEQLHSHHPTGSMLAPLPPGESGGPGFLLPTPPLTPFEHTPRYAGLTGHLPTPDTHKMVVS